VRGEARLIRRGCMHLRTVCVNGCMTRWNKPPLLNFVSSPSVALSSSHHSHGLSGAQRMQREAEDADAFDPAWSDPRYRLGFFAAA